LIFTIAPPFRFTEYAAAQGVKDTPGIDQSRVPEGVFTDEKVRGTV
jgi:hypothetical protein